MHIPAQCDRYDSSIITINQIYYYEPSFQDRLKKLLYFYLIAVVAMLVALLIVDLPDDILIPIYFSVH